MVKNLLKKLGADKLETLPEYRTSRFEPVNLLNHPIINSLFNNELKLKSVKGNKASFSSNGYCGIVSIPGLSYFITPQFGREMLDVLVPYAAEIYMKQSQAYNWIGANGDPFEESIGRLFLECYKKTIRSNIKQSFNQIQERVLRGSGVLETEKSLIYLFSGVGSPLWRRQTVDRNTYINKAVVRAFSDIIINLNLTTKTKIEIRNTIDEIGIGPSMENIDFNHAIDSLDRSNEHYRPFLNLAASLRNGATLTSGKRKSICFLMQSWRVFQQAFKNLLSYKASMANLKSNSNSTLSIRYTNSRNRLEPDLIVFNQAKKISLIGDLKYTRNDNLLLYRENMYQVNAYMSGYGTNRACLIYPCSVGFGHKIYKLRWGKEVHVFKVPVCDDKQFNIAVSVVLEKMT